MENTKDLLRRNVRIRRDELNLTQEELANKVDIAQNGIQRIESGTRVPRPETLDKLAEALGWKVYQLFMEDPYAIDPKPVEPPPTITELSKTIAAQAEEIEAVKKQLEQYRKIPLSLAELIGQVEEKSYIEKFTIGRLELEAGRREVQQKKGESEEA